MATKFRLSDESEADSLLLGIAGAIKDYQLVYHLNKSLLLHLAKMEDFRAEVRKNEPQVPFSFFLYEDSHRFLDFFLISNKSTEGVLLPDFRQADYLLLIQGPVSKEYLTEILKTIRAVPSILTAFKINTEKIKQIDTFYSEIELHTIEIKTRNKEH
jgi:hypothetical protein